MMITAPDHTGFRHAADLVHAWSRPVLITHTRPDGDALGSLAAMRLAFNALGIEATATLFDEPPDRYDFLKSSGDFKPWSDANTQAQVRHADAVVLLDTCAARQIEPAAAWLQSSGLPKLVIDHHVTRDIPADCYLIDESASAACLILHDWFKAAGWPIEQPMATALFVGLATDTGWFRHSNTDARTMAATAALINCGCHPHELFDLLFQRETATRFRLRAAATGQTRLLAEGRLAITTLPKTVFAECGASPADTEDLVNEPLRIGTVIVSVTLVEHGSNEIRISLRSRAPNPPGVPDVDVAAIAAQFGGGGHRRAAGARLTATLAEAEEKIVDRLQTALGKIAPVDELAPNGVVASNGASAPNGETAPMTEALKGRDSMTPELAPNSTGKPPQAEQSQPGLRGRNMKAQGNALGKGSPGK